jgi:hypothetical protein
MGNSRSRKATELKYKCPGILKHKTDVHEVTWRYLRWKFSATRQLTS